MKMLKCIIDEQDVDLVKDQKWHNDPDGYVIRTIHYRENPTDKKRKSKRIHIARVILARVFDRELTKFEVADHINGIKWDNRRSNLRICTQGQNKFNRKQNKANKSGFKNVWKSSRSRGKWESAISFYGQRKHLGTFKTKELAAEAYRSAALLYHGDYASTEYIRHSTSPINPQQVEPSAESVTHSHQP